MNCSLDNVFTAGLPWALTNIMVPKNSFVDEEEERRKKTDEVVRKRKETTDP